MSDEAATAEACNAYILAAAPPPRHIGAVAVGRGPATKRLADLAADRDRWRNRCAHWETLARRQHRTIRALHLALMLIPLAALAGLWFGLYLTGG